MQSQLRKVKSYLKILDQNRLRQIQKITDVEIAPSEYKAAGERPDPAAFVPFETSCERWGKGYDKHAWFRFSVEIPQINEGEEYLIRVYTDRGVTGWNSDNPQFIAYIDNQIAQGLDTFHHELFFKTSGKHEVLLYAYTGTRPCSPTLELELYRRHLLMEKLYWDIKIPTDSLELQDQNGYAYANILKHLHRAVSLMDLYEIDSEDFYTSLQAVSDYMDHEFYEKFCSPAKDGEPTVIGIGHTHIDCAWFWTLKQTREKVQRSFSTVVRLMEEYPEYRFMSSQALLYQNLKEEEPTLYEKVKELIREGRWECEGAMWVEADCNLTSGESLVRQVLYGKRFFKQEFDVENRVLWLPDVFGYSAALPQILKKSGVEWFVTSKISWNDTNQMPYDTFLWKGIDGTAINTYFLTAQAKTPGQPPKCTATYVANNTPAFMVGTYERYQQKELNNETITTFGWGDGGGGPTREEFESARRLSKGIPGIPTFKHDFAGNFLSRLEKKIENNPRLPVWQGELYLEFHRGTYTAQAKNKKNNRQSEFLYLNTELLCSMQKLFLDSKFPKEELHRGWELLLTNQFHDIIPGSSIRDVYEQCEIDYATIREIATPQLDAAAAALAAQIDKKNGYVVFNPNPTIGNGIVRVGDTCAYVENIPAKGYLATNAFKTDNRITLSETACEGKFFKLTFDANMNLVSIYDKRNKREVLRSGAIGNELRIYADHPDKFDAWEWVDFSLESYRTLTDVQSVEEIRDGARAGLRILRQHNKSTVAQTIWLYDDIDRIDFDLDVDWHERHQAMKVAFDVDINASRATYDIQYGSAERPTHKNTSWDKAKYEVCGQKFADFSEGNYGVALLNDCKYGYDIHGTCMMLSLLRSPTHPDPEADQGRMTCTYSLYPHKGAADLPTIYEHAYAINNPLTAVAATGDADRIPASFAMTSCDQRNILCETVKEAEDSDAHIFRYYECSNSRTPATLRFGFDVKQVVLCNMSEEPIRELCVTDNAVELDFGAFEIHTLKVN